MLSNRTLSHHFHPAKGWLNDPNGLSYFQGKYHIFYQHCPNCEHPGETMNWGHAVTDDFRNYEELPVALKPDMPYDIGGVWSGTAIEKDGRLYCYYASIGKDGKQTISVAFSDDGLRFEKYENNPIIRDYPADGSNDFRDPAILCCGDRNYLVIASADKKKGTGNLLLYSAENMLDWKYEGVLYEYDDCRYCECPSFIKYKDGYILSASVCPNHSNHYFEVMYGSFDGKAFVPSIISHFQKGPDEYAGQIFRAPDGRAILISWVPGWDYRYKRKCIGCLSLPLELTVKKGRIYAYPVKEVRNLLDKNDELVDSYITEKFINKGEEVTIFLNRKK